MPFRYAIGPGARERELDKALATFERVALCGAPNTGKTALASRITDRPVISTDQWRDFAWSEQPNYVVSACSMHERFVVEGVQVARAFRRGLTVDVLLWLVRPVAEQTIQQKALGKGIATVLESVREELAIPIVVIP